MMKMSYLRFACLFLAFATPAISGVAKRQLELPTVTLSYGTYRAAEYNEDADVRLYSRVELIFIILTSLGIYI
jgi:hypothetical protein